MNCSQILAENENSLRVLLMVQPVSVIMRKQTFRELSKDLCSLAAGGLLLLFVI
jgi:hypothetical protein